MPKWILYLTITLCLPFTLHGEKINLLYDTQSDGTIYPNSIWIVDMITEAGKKHHIEVTFEGAPWNRALDLVKEGVADGLINASYNKERAKFATYPFKNGQPDVTKSIQAPAYYLYTKKTSSLAFDGKKLINANGTIGAVQGYAVVANLKNLHAKIEYGQNAASNLKGVLHNTLIATAELEQEADLIINNNEALKQNLKKLPIPIRKKEYYLIISNHFYEQHPKIAHTLWQEIEKFNQLKKNR